MPVQKNMGFYMPKGFGILDLPQLHKVALVTYLLVKFHKFIDELALKFQLIHANDVYTQLPWQHNGFV